MGVGSLRTICGWCKNLMVGCLLFFNRGASNVWPFWLCLGGHSDEDEHALDLRVIVVDDDDDHRAVTSDAA